MDGTIWYIIGLTALLMVLGYLYIRGQWRAA